MFGGVTLGESRLSRTKHHQNPADSFSWHWSKGIMDGPKGTMDPVIHYCGCHCMSIRRFRWIPCIHVPTKVVEKGATVKERSTWALARCAAYQVVVSVLLVLVLTVGLRPSQGQRETKRIEFFSNDLMENTKTLNLIGERHSGTQWIYTHLRECFNTSVTVGSNGLHITTLKCLMLFHAG